MLNIQISILQEVKTVINVTKIPVTKCHQRFSLNNATSFQSGFIFVPELCAPSDCFMILRLRSFKINELSSGRQRLKLP